MSKGPGGQIHSHTHTYTHNPTSPSSQELPTSNPTPHSTTHHQPHAASQPRPSSPATPAASFQPHLPSPASAQPHSTAAPAPFLGPAPAGFPRPLHSLASVCSVLHSQLSGAPRHSQSEGPKWVTRRPGTLRPSLACLLVLFPFRSCSSSGTGLLTPSPLLISSSRFLLQRPFLIDHPPQTPNPSPFCVKRTLCALH